MGRKRLPTLRSNKKGTPLYSREDIREQYCITNKELDALDNNNHGSRGLFGCLPNQDWKSCNRGLLLPSCVRKSKIPSDENIASTDDAQVQAVRTVGAASGEMPGDAADQDCGGGAEEEEEEETGFERENGFGTSTIRRRPKAVCMTETSKQQQQQQQPQQQQQQQTQQAQPPPPQHRHTWAESESLVKAGRSRYEAAYAAQGSELSLESGATTPYRQAPRPTQLSLRSQDSGSMASDVISIESHEALLRRTPVTQPNTPDFSNVMLRRQAKTPDLYLEERRQKHVSFDSTSLVRSGGHGAFENTAGVTSPPSGRRTASPDKAKSQERLIDIGVKRPAVEMPDKRMGSVRSLDVMSSVGMSPAINQSLMLSKRKPMKTQATQTEISFAGKVLLPAYLTLSPRAAGYGQEDTVGIELRGDVVPPAPVPRTPRRLVKTPSESECEGFRDTDVHLKLYSIESATIVDHRVLDGLRRRLREEQHQREILVNFEPLIAERVLHRPVPMAGAPAPRILVKMPSEGNVLSRQRRDGRIRSFALDDRISERDSPAEKMKGKSDSEPLLSKNGGDDLDDSDLFHHSPPAPPPQFRAYEADERPPSDRRLPITRADSDESSQSRRRPHLREDSRTPSGESHRSESGSQYYSLTDHSSVPVSPEQQRHVVTQAEETQSPEAEEEEWIADDDRERPRSGSEKSMTSSSLEMDRTVAYSSDTEFGSVKSDDSHTVVDQGTQEDDIIDEQLIREGDEMNGSRTEPEQILPQQQKPLPRITAEEFHPPRPKSPEIKPETHLASPESESSSSHFTEKDTEASDKNNIVISRSDLSRTDSNKSDLGSETSEDYITATEHSNNGMEGRRISRRPAAKGAKRTDEESSSSRSDVPTPIAEDVVPEEQPSRLSLTLKDFSMIPEVLRESLNSVATSPSIESSTSGSYTVESGLSEHDMSRKLSSSTLGNSDTELDTTTTTTATTTVSLRVRGEPTTSKDDPKRYGRYLDSSPEPPQQDNSVRSKVAKFESLQQREVVGAATAQPTETPAKQVGTKEKHRVALEIRIDNGEMPPPKADEPRKKEVEERPPALPEKKAPPPKAPELPPKAVEVSLAEKKPPPELTEPKRSFPTKTTEAERQAALEKKRAAAASPDTVSEPVAAVPKVERKRSSRSPESLSESAILDRKPGRTTVEKPEIPPKPVLKDFQKEYTRRSLSPDAEQFLMGGRTEPSPRRHRRGHPRAKSDTEAYRVEASFVQALQHPSLHHPSLPPTPTTAAELTAKTPQEIPTKSPIEPQQPQPKVVQEIKHPPPQVTEPPSALEGEPKPKPQKTPKEMRRERRLHTVAVMKPEERTASQRREYRRAMSESPDVFRPPGGWAVSTRPLTEMGTVDIEMEERRAPSVEMHTEKVRTKRSRSRGGMEMEEGIGGAAERPAMSIAPSTSGWMTEQSHATTAAERRAMSESPDRHHRRSERSRSFSRDDFYAAADPHASTSPDRTADGRPRKHDRKALEFRRTISDTSDLLKIEKQKRLVARTSERELEFADVAKVLCSHCGERLRRSLESEAFTERFLLAEDRRGSMSRMSREVSPRTSESGVSYLLREPSSWQGSRDKDLGPSSPADLGAIRSDQSSLESLLRRSPRDTPVFLDSPVASGSQSSLRAETAQRTSVQDIALEEDEEDSGVYADSYRSSVWIYIGDNEELIVWSRPQSEKGEEPSQEALAIAAAAGRDLHRAESIESTVSEREFRKKYQAVTHRMVHRKSSIEMYRRLSSRTFDCDKVVTVTRKSGEFGFRIHGSRPVVVSAIEPGTPAESSGLEVGDIIISVNGISVLEASHSEVVKIAHTGTETLQLELARTCHVLAPIITDPERRKPVYSGFLYRLGGGSNKKWYRRWFVLKQDNCLYYYKSEKGRDPLGAIALLNHTVTRAGDIGQPFAFKVTKYGTASHFLAAEDDDSMNCWAALITQAATSAALSDLWMEMTSRNITLPAQTLPSPDCHGYLMKLGQRWKTWRRRYCVLKDGCLYFYTDAQATVALGVVHLHGYRVQTCLIMGKKYAFEAVPADSKLRHFYFHAENETDKKKWLAAMEYSIDRWIKIG